MREKGERTEGMKEVRKTDGRGSEDVGRKGNRKVDEGGRFSEEEKVKDGGGEIQVKGSN